MSQPAISVVISTANRRAALERVLASLERQRLPDGLDYEVIVVDNNSRDGTRSLVERLIRAGAPRLRYVFEPRVGVSYGRNAGIRMARAPIIAFTDDDNEVESDWLATIVAAFDAHPEAEAVGGPVSPIWPGPVPEWLDERHWSPLAILDYGDEPFYTSQAHPRCLLTANLGVRRTVFEHIGGFSPDFLRCQDHEWQIRFWRAGHRALYEPRMRVRAPVPSERLTRAYHRRWHLRHGEYGAAMRLQEIVSRSGQLLNSPAPSVAPFGIPGYVCRELAVEVGRAVARRLSGGAGAAFDHGNRVRYLTSYVRRRLWPRTSSTIRIDWPLPPASAPPRVTASLGWDAATSMSSGRLLTIHGLIVVLLGGTAWDLLHDREHWPLSPYAMFAQVDRDYTLTALRLFGVTTDDPPRLMPLLDYSMIAPFDQCRLSTALARAYHDPERRALIPQMLDDVLARYAHRQASGDHRGPPLRAIRLYEMTWPIEPGRPAVQSPTVRRLVDERPPLLLGGLP